ncbi:MAG: GSCFA domain-containing protein [Flavobacteriales bacterium]|nr:GSCFA domain-containing protein [Flavobacteriales bacterium]
MTAFRTVITPKKEHFQIDYNSKVLLIGSCFTEHISKKLDYFKFDTLTNPFGIVFNSSAIKTAVNHCVQNKVYAKADLNNHNDLWFSFNHHSQFSNPDLETSLMDINSKITEAHKFIKEASHIVITLGTAWVYTEKESGKIVANCHKIPQRNFTKSLQSIPQITSDLDNISKEIESVNPHAKLLFTVSPVRHLRNGFAENMLAKAHLIAAVHHYISNNDNSYYVPAYEIMMDDLRDYRFYEADMIHPNSTAVNYIWDYFKSSWISDKANTTMTKIDSIQKDLQHRPFNINTDAYKIFKQNLDKKIAAIAAIHPSIKF